MRNLQGLARQDFIKNKRKLLLVWFAGRKNLVHYSVSPSLTLLFNTKDFAMSIPPPTFGLAGSTVQNAKPNTSLASQSGTKLAFHKSIPVDIVQIMPRFGMNPQPNQTPHDLKDDSMPTYEVVKSFNSEDAAREAFFKMKEYAENLSFTRKPGESSSDYKARKKKLKKEKILKIITPEQELKEQVRNAYIQEGAANAGVINSAVTEDMLWFRTSTIVVDAPSGKKRSWFRKAPSREIRTTYNFEGTGIRITSNKIFKLSEDPLVANLGEIG
jgi:hypothetical protein